MKAQQQQHRYARHSQTVRPSSCNASVRALKPAFCILLYFAIAFSVMVGGTVVVGFRRTDRTKSTQTLFLSSMHTRPDIYLLAFHTLPFSAFSHFHVSRLGLPPRHFCAAFSFAVFSSCPASSAPPSSHHETQRSYYTCKHYFTECNWEVCCGLIAAIILSGRGTII